MIGEIIAYHMGKSAGRRQARYHTPPSRGDGDDGVIAVCVILLLVLASFGSCAPTEEPPLVKTHAPKQMMPFEVYTP